MAVSTAVAIASLIVAAVGTGVQVYQQQSSAEDAAHAAKMQAEAQAKYQKEMADANAKALDEQAQAEADVIQAAADRTKKTQRALAAKAGMDVNQGTALDLYKETDVLSKKDIGTVLGDAKRKGDLLKADATGQGALLTQKASDYGSQVQANANAATTGSLFSFTDTALNTAGKRNQTQNLLEQNKLAIQNENFITQKKITLTPTSTGPYQFR